MTMRILGSVLCLLVFFGILYYVGQVAGDVNTNVSYVWIVCCVICLVADILLLQHTKVLYKLIRRKLRILPAKVNK